MRTILQYLYESRALALKRRKMSDAQRNIVLGKLKEELGFIDNSLNGVMLSEAGFDEPATKLQETLVSGDFPNAIGDFVNRKILDGYQQKTFNFEPLVKPDTVTNFLPHTRHQNREQFDDLELIADKGSLRPGSLADATKRQWQAHVWGKRLDISWRTLKNDDLGYFNDTVTMFGRSARRSKEKFVSRMMTNATTIARLVGLGALYSTTGRLNASRIDTAISAFNQRTDDNGQPITARLAYVVHHAAHDGTIYTIKNSQQLPGTANNDINNANRISWTPIENPYLTGTAPTLPWYGFTDPMRDGITAFVLATLQGFNGPFTIRKKSDIELITSLTGQGAMPSLMMGDFATGNIQLGVLDIWGTYVDATEGNLVDYRGAYYSDGTAP